MDNNSNGAAVASLVLGIVGIWCGIKKVDSLFSRIS